MFSISGLLQKRVIMFCCCCRTKMDKCCPCIPLQPQITHNGGCAPQQMLIYHQQPHQHGFKPFCVSCVCVCFCFIAQLSFTNLQAIHDVHEISLKMCVSQKDQQSNHFATFQGSCLYRLPASLLFIILNREESQRGLQMPGIANASSYGWEL